jgi:hypothetical protein
MHRAIDRLEVLPQVLIMSTGIISIPYYPLEKDGAPECGGFAFQYDGQG